MKVIRFWKVNVAIQLVVFASQMGCQSESDNVPNLQEGVPSLMIVDPLIWHESTNPLTLRSLDHFYYDDYYYFLITENDGDCTNIHAETISSSNININPNKLRNFVFDINAYLPYTNVYDAETLLFSSYDRDEDCEQNLQIELSLSVGYGYRNLSKKSDISEVESLLNVNSITYSSHQGRFYIGGNKIGSEEVVPFVMQHRIGTTYGRRYDSLTRMQYLNLQGDEFIQIHELSYKRYLVTSRDEQNEITIHSFKENDIYDGFKYGLSLEWSVKLSDFRIFENSDFIDLTSASIYVAGTRYFGEEEVGVIYNLSKESGEIIWSREYDFSSGADSFYGIETSGASLFAYGYSNGSFDNDELGSSDGWAVQLNYSGNPITNYVVSQENSVSIISHIENEERDHSYNYDYIVIGGTVSRDGAHQVFAKNIWHE